MAMVTYEGDGEILVCELSHEETMLKEYFTEGGRDVDDYDRYLVEGTVEIRSSMRLDYDREIT